MKYICYKRKNMMYYLVAVETGISYYIIDSMPCKDNVYSIILKYTTNIIVITRGYIVYIVIQQVFF